MTRQAADQLVLADQQHCIVGVKGRGLCKPVDFGIKAEGYCTALYRGYLAEYRIEEGALLLTTLHVFTATASPPSIMGKAPRRSDSWLGDWSYEGIGFPCGFDGSLLLGRGEPPPISAAALVPLGCPIFPCPQNFAVVLELTFTNGRLASVQDWSEFIRQMARVGQDLCRSMPMPDAGGKSEGSRVAFKNLSQAIRDSWMEHLDGTKVEHLLSFYENLPGDISLG